MKHPIRIERYGGSLEKLARDIGHIRYDKVAEFLNYLAQDLARQADADLSLRGRNQLAGKLYSASQHILEGKLAVDTAMKISAKHMSEEELEGYVFKR
ncbi:MAG: hypothetical protein AABX11_05100 [Nanoarchaeota archaeon]